MNLRILPFFYVFLVFLSCEDTREGDTLPPAVSVLSPHPGDDVSGIVAIKVLTEDDSGILKVDFYVDNTLLYSDSIAPYTYDWNTENYLDGDYVINIHSWDNEGNVAKADPVHVRIANQSLYNLVINIASIKYVNSGFAIAWEQSTDNDFDSYTLLKSQDPTMSDADTIYYTRDISSVEYFDSDIAPSEYYYYRIMVQDTFGLRVVGKIKDAYSFVVFSKSFRDGKEYRGYSVQQTIDGGFIITGIAVPNIYDYSDVLLLKTDSYGNKIWSKSFGGSATDYGRSVYQTNDGGFVIAGMTSISGSGNKDALLIKTDSHGNEEWNKTFGGSSAEEGYYVQQTGDGGFIIVGATYSFGSGPADIWLIKTDSKGDEEWNKTYGGDGKAFAYSGQQTSDGGYIIIGKISNNVALIKTDSQGTEEWIQTFGESLVATGYSVQQTADGGYIATGELSDKLWLIKTDDLGNAVWSRTDYTSIYSSGNSVKQTPDDGYIIAGDVYLTEEDNRSKNVWLIKTNAQGSVEWEQTYGGDSTEVGDHVQITDDGGYIITGYQDYKYPALGVVLLLIKTDPIGNTTSWE